MVTIDTARADRFSFVVAGGPGTPNVDALAREGVGFVDAISPSPLTKPAHPSLLTGRLPPTHTVRDNGAYRLPESETRRAELLKAAGYRTGFIGKWHLDGGKREPGFDPPGARRQGFDYWAANECSHDHFNNRYFRDSPTPIPLGKYEAEGWTDLALEFLRQREERPFFLMVVMGPPHDPYKAPPRYEAMYDAGRLTMRPNWIDRTEMGSRQDIASYYAQITAIGRFAG